MTAVWIASAPSRSPMLHPPFQLAFPLPSSEPYSHLLADERPVEHVTFPPTAHHIYASGFQR